MKNTAFRSLLLSAMVSLFYLLISCSNSNNVTYTDLSFTLHIYYYNTAVVQKAAVIVNDSSGNIVDFKILNSPSEGDHPIMFSGVPMNGTVTVMTQSQRHLTSPTDDDYLTVRFTTFDIDMVKDHNIIMVSPISVYLNWRRFDFKTLNVSAQCPQDASYLGSKYYVPDTRATYSAFLNCSSEGIADGRVRRLVPQSDERISALLWAQVSKRTYRPSDYTDTLQYIPIIDFNSSNIFTADDLSYYSDAVKTLTLKVSDMPQDASLEYKITGLRKGAPLDGFYAYSTRGNPESSAVVADIFDKLESYIQYAKIYKEQYDDSGKFSYVESYRFHNVGEIVTNDVWDISDFPTLPESGNISANQTGNHLILKYQNLNYSNIIYKIYTAKVQPNPTVAIWRVYTGTHNTSTTSPEYYTFPLLPDELQEYSPNINYDYVYVDIIGRNYNFYPTNLVDSGQGSYIYVVIRNILSSSTSIQYARNLGMSDIPENMLEFPPFY